MINIIVTTILIIEGFIYQNKMDNLPIDIFVNILTFLDFPVFNRLSHTCRKEHFLYKFNKKYSLEYYQGKIDNPPKRISLDLSWNDNIKSLIPIKDVEEVNIHKCPNIVDLSPIINVKKLQIGVNKKIKKFPYFPYLKEIDVFRIENIIDVNFMKNAKIIYIESINNLSDVSPLKNAEDLTLCECPNIVDVSMLGNIKKLYLECEGVTDVSNLTGVEDLTLHCSKIRDVSMLSGIKKIVFPNNCDIDCNLFKDAEQISINGRDSCVENVNVFSKAEEIELSEIDEEIDITSFKSVIDLELYKCYLSNTVISGLDLSKMCSLDLTDCSGIDIIKDLRDIKKVILKGSSVKSIMNIKNVDLLDLSSCSKLTEISKLSDINIMRIGASKNIICMDKLNNVNNIEFKKP
jgi:hypothetical protein